MERNLSDEEARSRNAAEKESQALLNRLREAERVRQDTVMALTAFQAELERNLRVYRSQRAWKAMLFLRKAYALLVKPGWRAKLEFVRWLLSRKRPGWLDEYELHMPDVLSYAPQRVHGSFLDPAFGSAPATCSTAPHRSYDVIVLPVFEFDFRFQRPQQVACEFARQGHRVFWISPTRVLAPEAGQPYEAVPLSASLWEIHPRVSPADVYDDVIEDVAVSAFSACLRQLMKDWGVAENCVVVQLPFWRRVALALREGAGSTILYDCMDNWQAMPALSEFNRSEENELVRECDVFTVTGRTLQERHFVASGRQGIVVRNAADFRFFSSVQPHGILEGIERPIVGYFGAIADWFDFDLLAEVARSRPHYSFVLIGASGTEGGVWVSGVSKLRGLPNVHLLGHKSYRAIPSYLAEFDACIIPFAVNPLTRATDPVKLYEYFSQGKPVVATPLDEPECGDGLLYTATGAADFAAKLDRALGEHDRELRRRRIEFASSHTWSDRYKAIDGAVRQAFPLVSVAVVTYNSAEFVAPCLDSIERSTAYPNYEVVIVDNGSQDETLSLIEPYAAGDRRIRLIRNGENAGFAGANNLALARAKGEYFLLLNPDTMVTPGWIGGLLRHCLRDPSVGLVVPVTNSAGNEVKINVPYSNSEEMEQFARELARRNGGTTRDIEVAPLFCALIPRPVWENVGGLDERFEVGMFEDDDLSLRVAAAGYRVVAAEDCFVHHFGQGAFSKLARSHYERVFARNRERFEKKWGIAWTPHRYRQGVGPDGVRATPREFVKLKVTRYSDSAEEARR